MPMIVQVLPTPAPTSSETPWRCYHLQIGVDTELVPNKSSPMRQQKSSTRNLEFFERVSMIAANIDHFYLFWGYQGAKAICQLELDVSNSLATTRNVPELGTPPSPRYFHGSVMLSSSLMVVWGGTAVGLTQYSDNNIHLLDLSEFEKGFHLLVGNPV